MGKRFLLLFLAWTFLQGQLPAQSPPQSAPQYRAMNAEILAYQLTLTRADHLISALPPMSRFFMSQSQEVLAKWSKMTVDRKIANLEKSPDAMAILKPYQLTAKDYIVGVPALRMALWRAEGIAESPKVYASPANLEFARKNLIQLKPRWEAVDGARGPKS